MSTSSEARDIAESAIRAAESDVTRLHSAVMRGAFAGEARQAQATVRRRADSPLAAPTSDRCPSPGGACRGEMRVTQYEGQRMTRRVCTLCEYTVQRAWTSKREKG